MTTTKTKRSDDTRLRTRKGKYAAECTFCYCPDGCACEGDCACGHMKGAPEKPSSLAALVAKAMAR